MNSLIKWIAERIPPGPAQANIGMEGAYRVHEKYLGHHKLNQEEIKAFGQTTSEAKRKK